MPQFDVCIGNMSPGSCCWRSFDDSVWNSVAGQHLCIFNGGVFASLIARVCLTKRASVAVYKLASFFVAEQLISGRGQLVWRNKHWDFPCLLFSSRWHAVSVNDNIDQYWTSIDFCGIIITPTRLSHSLKPSSMRQPNTGRFRIEGYTYWLGYTIHLSENCCLPRLISNQNLSLRRSYIALHIQIDYSPSRLMLINKIAKRWFWWWQSIPIVIH